MKKVLLLTAVVGVIAAITAIAEIPGSFIGQAASSKTVQKTVALPASPELVASGKILLNNHSIIAARDTFKQAVTTDPTNQEAQFLYGVTRILAIYEDGQGGNTSGLDNIREILELSGLNFSSFGLYNTRSTSGNGSSGLPSSTPSTGAVIAYLSSKVLPEITGAIANLDAVTDTSFLSSISPAATANSTTSTISVDYSDVLVTKAIAHLAACNLQLLGVYGLDFSPPQILNGDVGQIKRFHDLLLGSDKLLTPQNPAKLTAGKTELVSFIDTFNQSITTIKSRTGGGVHLYALDQPLNDTRIGATSYQITEIRNALADVKASLSGPTFSSFAGNTVVDLSKFFNSAAPINFRTLAVDCGSGGVLSDPTLGGIIPMGLGRLEQTVLLHAQEIRSGVCAGSETPKISVTPDSPWFYYGPGYSSPPSPITIENREGTADLAISSITLKGDSAADYRLSVGTCQTLTPLLAPGNSCTLLASYQPASGMSYAASRAYIDIASNDQLTPHFTVPLSVSGSGTLTPYQLNVAVRTSGTASGIVASAPEFPGINCPVGSCFMQVPTYMTSQRLIATAASASILSSWNGCDRIEGEDCVVNMISNRLVTATFAPNSKPLVLNAYPAAGHYSATGTVTLLANKVVDIYYTLDGSSPTTSSLHYNGAITLPAGATTTVKYMALDATGPTATASATYIIDSADTQPPVITDFAASRSVGNGIVITKFSASDNVNVKNYCVTSTNNASLCSWSKEIPTNFYQSNATSLYAFAKDEAGNISAGYRYNLNPSVMLSWGSVYHRLGSDGIEYDSLDVGVTSTYSTLAAAGVASLTVTGPGNYSYTFTDSDYNPSPNSPLSFFKSTAASVTTPQQLLTPGVYTFTLTDTSGHTSHRMSTYVRPARTLPAVDSTTIQTQRKSDGSYRFRWAPVNDTTTYYYRLKISNNATGNAIYNSVRSMVTYIDVPAGTMSDAITYKARVEVYDSSSIDLITNRTDSVFSAPFTPQASDFTSSRLLTNFSTLDNRTDDTTQSIEAMLNVDYPEQVQSITLSGPAAFTPYQFDLKNDFSLRTTDGTTSIKDFSHKFTTTIPPGLYTFTYVANGITHTAYATLTLPVTYPVVDSATMQAEDLGNGSIHFSWANVNHTGALYYRVVVNDTVSTISYLTSRQNQTYVDISKTLLGDPSSKQWRVEVYDSSDVTTQRNRFNTPYSGLAVQGYSASRPIFSSFRVRSATLSNGVLSSHISAGVSGSTALAEIRVTGPNGYNHELLSEGSFSGIFGEYALTTPGAPTVGLYAITAKDVSGNTATRYMYQTASHVIPQVDFHTFRVDPETNGDLRVSWAPVVADVPVWYSLVVLGQNQFNSDVQMERVYASGSTQVVSMVIPSANIPSVPAMMMVLAVDGSNYSVADNDSRSVMVGLDAGHDYNILTDSDSDGFASNVDANDTNSAVYPFSGSNSAPLSVVSFGPTGTNNATTSSISVTFNKNINQRTLPSNFSLFNSTIKSGVSGSVTYNPITHIATFTPSVPLVASNAYSVTIAQNVADEFGHTLGSNFASWNFTTTGLSTLPSAITPTFVTAPVTLGWGSVYHRTDGTGTRVDTLDAGIKVTTATLTGMNITVTGPNGFTPYTFTDADIMPYVPGQTALIKEYPVNSLPYGVYTFTMTDANGNVSYRLSTNVAATTPLPQVDTGTLQIQRKTGTDNSYRISWAPLNDTRPVYYRIRISQTDSAHTAVYTSTRNMITYADVPAATLTDGIAYSVRVETTDAPTTDLTTNRSQTLYVNFTPQSSDYNASRLLVNYAVLNNRTDSNGALSSEVDLSVSAPTAVSSVDLRDTSGNVIYTFLPGDRSNQEFYKRFTTPLNPGSYIVHFIANGLNHNAYVTLTTPVAYPQPNTTTMQAEDQGNGYIRFSWANVDHTGPVYYRAFIYDKVIGPLINGATTASARQNVPFIDLPKSLIGDLSTKEWRVEAYDSNHITTQRNRTNSAFINLTLAPYNAGKPVISSWRVRSMTNSSAVTTSMILVNASSPQGTLAEIRVTGPNGYSRDLLSQGRWSNVYGSYVIEESGLPAAGLYMFTARDTAGNSTTRYHYQTSAHPLPPVNYRTFKTNMEPDGSIRLSWAPVVSDIPLWYSANFYSSTDMSTGSGGATDGLMDPVYNAYGFVDVTNDGTTDQLTVYPLTSITIPPSAFANLTAPPLFWITTQDGGQSMPVLATSGAAGVTYAPTLTGEIVHNVSHSVMVKGENIGFNYASLTDADGDGFASNTDSNDANAAVYPFSSGNDIMNLEITSQSPYSWSGNVSPTTSVCASFNKVIDQRTLPGNFILSNGATGYYTFTPSSKTVCLKPSAPLPENAALTAIIGTGVKDLAGNGMASPVIWNFTIAGTPVTSVSPAGGTFATPQLINLSSNSPGAVIYYTTDGTTPQYPQSGSTQVYSGPITVSRSTTLKYFSQDAAGISESLNTQVYTISVPTAPTGVEAAGAADHVSLSWNPADGAQSYKVYLAGVSSPATAGGTLFKDALT